MTTWNTWNGKQVRMSEHFTIVNLQELIQYLEYYDLYNGERDDVLELWRQRQYFDNLLYLEYLNERKKTL